MTPSRRGHTRRQLLGAGVGLGAGGLLSLAGCAGPLRTVAHRGFLEVPLAEGPGRVAVALAPDGAPREIAEAVVAQVGGLGWLSRGDSVFVKVACNSDNRHPAVTSPEAVEAAVAMLKDRGAGRILVGDQAGVGHVRLTPEGRRNSTREMMSRNGLLGAIRRSGAELHAFDDQGWDGYFRAEADFEDLWDGELWLARVLEEVDHVVSLPRLGVHALAGYTCAIKNAVGWLRDDSRRSLHQRGDRFFERIAQINHFRPLREKLRLVLTLGRGALLDVGPDMGGEYDFGGPMALASTRLVDHDALASAMLPWLDDDHVSFYDLYTPYPEHADHWNAGLVEEIWGEPARRDYRRLEPPRPGPGLEHDACVAHLAVLQGYRPRRIEVPGTVDRLPKGLVAHLRAFGGGLFAI